MGFRVLLTDPYAHLSSLTGQGSLDNPFNPSEISDGRAGRLLQELGVDEGEL